MAVSFEAVAEGAGAIGEGVGSESPSSSIGPLQAASRVASSSIPPVRTASRFVRRFDFNCDFELKNKSLIRFEYGS
jgi:hypothetical protein